MMNRRDLTCLLVLFTMALAIAEAEHGQSNLRIEGTEVTLICPIEGEGVTWEIDGINAASGSQLIIENYADHNNKLYKCTTGEQSYYFYTNLKVCESCVELDMILAMGVVFGDVLITVGVILMVYLCAKGKASPAPQRAQRRQPSSAPSAPPSEPAYQALNPGTRGKDVYSDVKRKK